MTAASAHRTAHSAPLLARAERRLEIATRILDGDTKLPRASRSRVAALFARCAAEDLVEARWRAAGLGLEGCSMRVTLAVLGTRFPDWTAPLSLAWVRLSDACHQHAYELAPSGAEVRHLMDAVRRGGTDLVADPPAVRP